MNKLNSEVTKLIESQKHPLEESITELRKLILSAEESLAENIKWNGPNYSVGQVDRITVRTQPTTQLQLIFHRGAKVQQQPKDHLIEDEAGLLVWKENDRAILTIKDPGFIQTHKSEIAQYVREWVRVTQLS